MRFSIPAEKRSELLAIFAIAVAFIIMAWISWRRWPDLLIDFGMQLYVPWQLSEGKVLYRDIAYMTGGPFSQLYHSLLFRTFGSSLTVILVSNFAFLIFFLAVLYNRFRAATDVLTAALISLAVISGFAFAEYLSIGNYNFICPYSHEATHGLIFSVTCLAFLSTYAASKKTGYLLTGGLCYGAAFLTKPETFFALTLCLLAYCFLLWRQKKNHPIGIGDVGFFTGGTLLLPAAAFFYFFSNGTAAVESVRYVSWAWVPLLTTSAANNTFYQWCLGLDAPLFHLRWSAAHFLTLMLVIGFLAWRCRKVPENSAGRILFISITGGLALAAVFFDWTAVGRSMPWIVLTALLLLLNEHKKEQPGKPPTFPLLLGIFGFFLLAKLGVHTRIWHYGFYLALPAALIAVYFLIWLLPRKLERFGTHAKLFRAVITILLLIGFARLVAQSNYRYEQKTFGIGQAGDRLLTVDPDNDGTSKDVARALQWIEANISSEETMAVLPEGVILNYLTRRENPTPFLNFNPPEIASFGYDRMFTAYRETPPDYIVLVHRESAEFGVDYFGKEEQFGRSMMQWINEKYKPVLLIGYEPLKNGLFGIKILKKKSEND